MPRNVFIYRVIVPPLLGNPYFYLAPKSIQRENSSQLSCRLLDSIMQSTRIFLSLLSLATSISASPLDVQKLEARQQWNPFSPCSSCFRSSWTQGAGTRHSILDSILHNSNFGNQNARLTRTFSKQSVESSIRTFAHENIKMHLLCLSAISHILSTLTALPPRPRHTPQRNGAPTTYTRPTGARPTPPLH